MQRMNSCLHVVVFFVEDGVGAVAPLVAGIVAPSLSCFDSVEIAGDGSPVNFVAAPPTSAYHKTQNRILLVHTTFLSLLNRILSPLPSHSPELCETRFGSLSCVNVITPDFSGPEGGTH